MSSQENIQGIASVVEFIRGRGVALWCEGGELRFRAPKGTLNAHDIEVLRRSRPKIIAYLSCTDDRQSHAALSSVRTQVQRAPLTFNQLTHWRARCLGERPGLRQLASATRLSGRLDVSLLEEAVQQIVSRHEALRTRIVNDGEPAQIVARTADRKLACEDLTELSGDNRARALHALIRKLILQSIDVAVGPLVEVRLAKLRDDEHVLLVVMEHMISDAASLSIFLREVLTSYTRRAVGLAPSLPLIAMQFPEYAMLQRRTQQTWLETHGAYWHARLEGCRRLRFPACSTEAAGSAGWGTVPVWISGDTKSALEVWARRARTTLVMGLFTAYVALVLRWCRASDAVLRYQTDGRSHPGVENTIGFFASLLNLRVELHDEDNFLDLLRRLTEEYCNAYEHADFGYFDALAPQADYLANSVFNWVPEKRQNASPESTPLAQAIALGSVEFANPVLETWDWDGEPSLLLYERETEIAGMVSFPRRRFAAADMERFVRNYHVYVSALLAHPEQKVMDVVLQ